MLLSPEQVIADSAEIIAWVDARYPSSSGSSQPTLRSAAPRSSCARALTRRSGLRQAPDLRAHVRAGRKLAIEFNNQGVPAWEDLAARRCWPLLQLLVEPRARDPPGVEVHDEAIVWRELDHVAELLADGRPYLHGERFGAADLTFAALCAPVLLPSDYGVTLPQPERLDATTGRSGAPRARSTPGASRSSSSRASAAEPRSCRSARCAARRCRCPPSLPLPLPAAAKGRGVSAKSAARRS